MRNFLQEQKTGQEKIAKYRVLSVSADLISIIAVELANRWRFKSKSWMNIDLFKRRGPSVPIQNGAAAE